MPLHNHKAALNSILLPNDENNNLALEKEYIALKKDLSIDSPHTTLCDFINEQTNQQELYLILEKALKNQTYLANPDKDHPWKLIIMLIIHMSTLKKNATDDQLIQLNQSILSLSHPCKQIIADALKNDEDVPRLLESAIIHLAENNIHIPSYLHQINEKLLLNRLNLDEAWKKPRGLANPDLNKKSEHSESSDDEDPALKPRKRSEYSYLDKLKTNMMSNDDWTNLTQELIEEKIEITHDKPLMKALVQHHKQNLLKAIRDNKTLQDLLLQKATTLEKISTTYTADGKNIRTNHALLSLFSTTKRSSTTRAFGKTKSAIELCSIMKWSTGVRRKPSSYLNIENNNDELLTLLINKMDSITANKLKEWLHNVHLWEEPLPLKLHIILLTLAQKNEAFQEQTTVIDMLLDKKLFSVDAFITHLLTLTKKPENWPDLQTILPLTAYLLGKTKAQDLSKDNLQHLSHREFKQPFLFAVKSHYDTFSDLVDSKKQNALNAVIDFHQWQPKLFTTKTRTHIEALKIKPKPNTT